MSIRLQQGIVYGPVSSRRLGRSLGVNLLPTDWKQCTFDCIYCQYGWTVRKGEIDPEAYPTVETVSAAVRQALTMCDPPPAYVTFSGNGEATLHPEFPAIVREVVTQRDRWAPSTRTAILSNATTLSSRPIQESLALLDARILKLDAGNDEVLQRYNGPDPVISFEELLQGICAVENVTIQTLFTGGPSGNYEGSHLAEWVAAIRRINPLHVQLYTLSRPYPSREIAPVTREDLLTVKERLAKIRVSAEVY